MATTKSYAKNPSQPKQHAKAATGAKANPAKKTGTATAKKASGSKAMTTTKKKPVKNYRTNTAASKFGGVMAAFVGAGIITGFDLLMGRFLPASITSTWRMLIKFGAGFAADYFGSKWKFTRSHAPTVRNALWLAGGLDFYSTQVVPRFNSWMAGVQLPAAIQSLLGHQAAAVVPVGAVQSPTGEMGSAWLMPNGQPLEIYGGTWQQPNVGYNPQALVPMGGGGGSMWDNYNSRMAALG